MSKRINIILPDETIKTLEKLAPKGDRSGFISKAVQYYVINKGNAILREQLKSGYQANAKRDLEIAAEWFPLEEEAWQKFSQQQTKLKKPKRS